MSIINKPPLTISQLADRWGVTAQTLHLWRLNNKGPAFLKLGRKTIRYPQEAIEKYEAENMRNNI